MGRDSSLAVFLEAYSMYAIPQCGVKPADGRPADGRASAQRTRAGVPFLLLVERWPRRGECYSRRRV